MNDLVVEWSHPVMVPPAPPVRCSDTDRAVSQVVYEMKGLFSSHGCEISFVETDYKEGEDKHRSILNFNGKALEEVVPFADPRKYCGLSCSGCGSDEENCTRRYENIPESVLRLAILRAGGLK